MNPSLERAAEPVGPWTNVYGLARSALAFGTLLTLLFNDSDLLFRPMGGEITGVFGRIGPFAWSLFFLVPDAYLEVARWASILVLLLVVAGWRPRVTGVLHWYVAFSFTSASVMVDGGDHVATVLTLLLVPLTLTDGRKWHWSPPPEIGNRTATLIGSQVGLSSLLVIRLQVALIYFHAAVGKMDVPEWADGTAVYYWFTHTAFGASPWLEPLLMPFITSPLLVTALTWSVIILELSLFLGLGMDKRWRPWLLVVGLSFHASIIVVHGLISFFFSMTGALILLLRPAEQPFRAPDWLAVRQPALAWAARLRIRRPGFTAPA